MQAILFLLGLFAIGCVLFGISAGVQLIRHGVSGLWTGARAARHPRPSTPMGGAAAPASPSAVPAPVAQSDRAPIPPSSPPLAPSPVQHGIAELRALFALYQQGALTLAEFQGLKCAVLAGMAEADIQTTQPGTP